MSPLRPGRADVGVSPERLTDAVRALGEALDAGGHELPEAERRWADAVVDKVGERMALVGGHTVVALAGATGSGKSSLFNALVGEPVARAGVRRPTTSTATAAIWGNEPADALLDWLGVPSRHLVNPKLSTGPEMGSLHGLILIDLPDMDSRELANRLESDRLLSLVDLFVWVTDPQKYADARLHDDHVAALATHEAVTVAVLNQVDLLQPDDVERCRVDLGRLVERDGAPGVSVLTTSAKTGAGLPELRQRLANTVAGRSAARGRLAADIRAAAAGLEASVAPSEPTVKDRDRRELIDALSRAAGVPTVVDAVERDYRMAASSMTGWPFSRWVGRLRSRPLRRLRLDGRDVRVTESDVRSVLGRSSLPPPSPAARAAVDNATRRLADSASAELPSPWADAVHRAAGPADADLGDSLDQAIVGTSLIARQPLWWRVAGVIQLLLAAAAVAGVMWLAAYVVVGLLQLDAVVPAAPTVGVVPWPFLLLFVGVVGGLLVSLAAWPLARVGARRRGSLIRKRLDAAIAEVAHDKIVEPVTTVLDRHARTRKALERAAAV